MSCNELTLILGRVVLRRAVESHLTSNIFSVMTAYCVYTHSRTRQLTRRLEFCAADGAQSKELNQVNNIITAACIICASGTPSHSIVSQPKFT